MKFDFLINKIKTLIELLETPPPPPIRIIILKGCRILGKLLKFLLKLWKALKRVSVDAVPREAFVILF